MYNFLEYFFSQKEQILSLGIEHIKLTFTALFFAIVIGVVGGLLVSNTKKTKNILLAIANAVQAIPSIAILGFSIPLFGIGATPAVFAVAVYSVLPILKGTITGLNSINPQTIEAANGIGMTRFQRMWYVQIPISLPIIMSGIRIATVTGVGLMTMAAFVGAGGLGHLVFSGIRTVNNYQILSGAIPACVLALLVDYIAGKIESKLTSRTTGKVTKKILLLMAVSLFTVFIAVSANKILKPKETGIITIGSKDFTEQHVLANILSELIKERLGIKVKTAVNLGGTKICFEALDKGDIDIYVEYTGTIYGDILKQPLSGDLTDIFQNASDMLSSQYELKMLGKLGFNNTYTLAMKKENAQKLNIRSMSDLSPHTSEMLFASSFECLNRNDCYLGFSKLYGIQFKKSLGMDGSPRYLALNTDQVDVIDAFATDGLLIKYNLLILDDDKQFFPPYDAVPLIRKDTLAKYPEIEPLLGEISKYLDGKTMSQLNYQVDELGEEPAKVAREFLKNNGLI